MIPWWVGIIIGVVIIILGWVLPPLIIKRKDYTGWRDIIIAQWQVGITVMGIFMSLFLAIFLSGMTQINDRIDRVGDKVDKLGEKMDKLGEKMDKYYYELKEDIKKR